MRNKLSVRQVQTAKKVGRYADGGGLYLLICRPGYKQWTFRYMLARRAREMALGPVTDVSLAQARVKAAEARALTREGRDPIAVKDEAQAALKAEELKTLTFRQAAEQFLETERVEQFKNAKHRQQWRSTLESYAFPVIGDLPLKQIDSGIVLQTLLPVWERVPETASRLRGRIERIFSWCKAHKLFDGAENPASRDVLRDALPVRVKPRHHPALPYAEIPAFMADLRQRDCTSARCLEFCILTATRTSETINATWDEVDVDAGVWTIPGSRMKGKKDHRVPLSPRSVEILKANYRHGVSGTIFINGGGLPLSNQAMSELLKGMMPPERGTVHGFRSSFRDWVAEQTNYPNHVAEMALAHVVKNKTEAAYRRGDLFSKRARLMDVWARFCAPPSIAGRPRARPSAP